MVDVIVLVIVVLVVLNILLGFVLIKKIGEISGNKSEQILREEFRQARVESDRQARELRGELNQTQKNATEALGQSQKVATENLVNSIGQLGKSQGQQLQQVEKRVQELMQSNEQRVARIDQTLDKKIQSLQESNEKKLDQMRATVDEKLQTTLEKRLGESFKIVSERLEAVQRGLGEMKNLATGVDNLKKVLTNVKTRGTWGEVQLGSLLSEILTPDQFAKNVKPVPGSNNIVEFAIKLPGFEERSNSKVWLPIDAKFPQEDYERLQDASENGNEAAVRQSHDALIRSIKNSAKEISDKYVSPPATTDFAILFLPTEGLYAEVLREPGLVANLQQNFRIVIAGPTTLAAILNSLRMGFRTLAIEKRSSEVWKTLAEVKFEFGKFGGVLEKVKKQLDTASKTIEDTGKRSRAIERKLRDVEDLPELENKQVPALPGLE